MNNDKSKLNDDTIDLMNNSLNEAIEKLDNIDDVEDIVTASLSGIIICCNI